MTKPGAARLPAFSAYSGIVRIVQMPDEKTQLDKFKEAAHELETDDDPQHSRRDLGSW